MAQPAFEQKPNRGAIFINKNKKSDNQPDMRGDVHVDRNLLIDLLTKHKDKPLIGLSISCWKQVGKTSGEQYLSAAVSEPYEKPATEADKNPWE
jgi:hypothetical protein